MTRSSGIDAGYRTRKADIRLAISYFTSEAKRHWLTDVAEAAGLHDLRLPPRAPFAQVRAAWAEVARTANITEEQLAERVAGHFRLKVADLQTAEPQTSKLIPEKLARRHGILPLRASDQVIVVATADPVSMEAEQAVQFLSGRQPVFQVAAPGLLVEAIDAAYSRAKILDFVLQTLAAESGGDDVKIVQSNEGPSVDGGRAKSIADLVKRMLRQAVVVGATSVRIDPEREAGQVRFRVDGVLEHFMHLPRPALLRVVERIKQLAKLDVEERRSTQEGQFRATVGGRAYRMRVETEPSGSLERVTLSITCPSLTTNLDGLELSQTSHAALSQLLEQPSGVIVVAAPRRTSRERLVHASLARVRDAGRRVASIETQIGYDLDGIEQTKVDPRRGFPVSSAVAQMMENLPEALALEPLEDEAAASLAFDAAERGSLVVIQSDAEDLASALARLTELGVDRERIARLVRGVVVCRSVRRLCECAKPVMAPDDMPSAERALAEAYQVTPARVANGCAKCRATGYRGEIPVLETARVEGDIAEAIRSGALLSTVVASARDQGDPDLRQSAIARASGGDTTLQEVERVLGRWSEDDPEPGPPCVLVVDDTASDRLLMRTLLEQKGFRVIEASGGHQALRVLDEENDVSLVLLDLLMPEMSGQQTLTKIRTSVATAGLPVVILTAAEDPKLELDLLAAGADDYLRKPFEPSRLSVRVRAVMRRSGSYDPDPAGYS